MSLKVRLEAELLRCHAECETVAAELKQIMARADPLRIVELEPAIGAVLKRLKKAPVTSVRLAARH
jgi:hypothetical protein